MDTNFNLARFARASSATGNLGGDSLVSEAGEWAFDGGTDELTFWSGTASSSITLVGAVSVTADASTTLEVSY